jgi:pimeloyl-ACP methyl ester carboxylesterase
MKNTSTLHVPTPQQVAAAFLTPTPTPSAAGLTLDFLPNGQRFEFEGPVGPIAATRSGNGSKVLLVHGWSGHSSDMAAFAAPLVEGGFEVVALDLPAHGESGGRMASIPQGAEALLDLQKLTGDFHALIAHSVGTAVAVHAMGKGLRVTRAVLLSPPARYADYAAGFAAQAGLGKQQTQEMIEILRLQYGLDVDSVNTPVTAKTLTQPALVLHSADDRVVPIGDGLEIANAWRDARLVQFEGLGHRRILQDAEVRAEVLAFISQS